MPRVRGSISKDRVIDAESLREVLKPILQELKMSGVKDDDLPSNEELVGRLLGFLDQKAVREWVGKYADWTKDKP